MPLLPRPPHQLVLPLDGTVPPLCPDIQGPTTRHRIQRGCQASPPLYRKNLRLSATGGTGCTSPPPPPSCPPSLATKALAAAPLSLCPPRAPTVGERATQNTRGASRRPLCTRGTKTDRNTSKRWSEDNLLSPAPNKVLAHQRRLSPVRPPVTDEGRRPLQHVRSVTPVLPLVSPATPRPPPPRKTVTRSIKKLSGMINSWGAHL